MESDSIFFQFLSNQLPFNMLADRKHLRLCRNVNLPVIYQFHLKTTGKDTETGQNSLVFVHDEAW